jgi:nitrogen regulatory protein PII
MRKIEAIIDPSKMQEVKNALTKFGIRRPRCYVYMVIGPYKTID